MYIGFGCSQSLAHYVCGRLADEKHQQDIIFIQETRELLESSCACARPALMTVVNKRLSAISLVTFARIGNVLFPSSW